MIFSEISAKNNEQVEESFNKLFMMSIDYQRTKIIEKMQTVNEERGVNLEVINSRENSQSEESNEDTEESNPTRRLEPSRNDTRKNYSVDRKRHQGRERSGLQNESRGTMHL